MAAEDEVYMGRDSALKVESNKTVKNRNLSESTYPE